MDGWIDVDGIKKRFWKWNEHDADEEGRNVVDEILECKGQQGNDKDQEMKNADKNKNYKAAEDELE